MEKKKNGQGSYGKGEAREGSGAQFVSKKKEGKKMMLKKVVKQNGREVLG